jgi:REP element-mobilizing transposase RayT
VASLPRRESVRLPGYDYTRPGAYFITICSQDKQPILGQIIDGEMHYTELGKLVQTCWLAIPEHFPNVTVDAFVVMPNHVHGILLLTDMRVE